MTSGYKRIGINKPSHLRIVISALEIIQPGLCVVDVSTIAQGVGLTEGIGHGAGDAKRGTPGVVGIRNYRRTTGIQDTGDITLEIGGVVVSIAAIGDGHGCTACVIAEVQRIAADGHLAQTAAVIDVLIGSRPVTSGDPHTVGIVVEAPAGSTVIHSGKLPAMLPCIPPGAVVYWVADAVVIDRNTIVLLQQILPGGIRIAIGVGFRRRSGRSRGVGILVFREDVAAAVVGPYRGSVCGLIVLPGQLIGGIIGVGGSLVIIVSDGNDAAVLYVVELAMRQKKTLE